MKITMVLSLVLIPLSFPVFGLEYTGEEQIAPKFYTSSISNIANALYLTNDPNLQDVILLRCAAVQFTKRDYMREQGELYSNNTIATVHNVGEFFYSYLTSRRVQSTDNSSINRQETADFLNGILGDHMDVYLNHIEHAVGDPINEPIIAQDSRYCYTLMEEL